LEVADESLAQLRPVINPTATQVLEPCSCRVTEVERQVFDEEKVICCSTRVTRETIVLQPHTRIGLPVVSGMLFRARKCEETSRLAPSDRRRAGPFGPVTSCDHDRRRCHSALHAFGRPVGVGDACLDGRGHRCSRSCRHWQLDGEPQWCSGHRGWARCMTAEPSASSPRCGART
jgi:hypothetical protein